MRVKQTSTSRYTPYAKYMLRIAVCDVLDLAGCHDYCESHRDGAEIVTASVEALDRRSEFCFHIQDWMLGSLLTVTITQPCFGLSRAGEQRAVDNLADRVLQLVENTTRAHPPSRTEGERQAEEKGKNQGGLLAFLGGKAHIRERRERAGRRGPVTRAREESKWERRG